MNDSDAATRSNPTSDVLRTDSPSSSPLINASEAPLALQTPIAARIITAGESAEEYGALVEAVTEFWQPQNVIEQLQMTDFIQAEWELRRLRRLVAAAFVAGKPFAVSKLSGYSEKRFCDSAFPSGVGDYKEELAKLAIRGLTCDALDGQTLLMHAAAFESFDRRSAVLEHRRDSAWEKVERRRSAMKTISPPALSGKNRE